MLTHMSKVLNKYSAKAWIATLLGKGNESQQNSIMLHKSPLLFSTSSTRSPHDSKSCLSQLCQTSFCCKSSNIPLHKTFGTSLKHAAAINPQHWTLLPCLRSKDPIYFFENFYLQSFLGEPLKNEFLNLTPRREATLVPFIRVRALSSRWLICRSDHRRGSLG